MSNAAGNAAGKAAGAIKGFLSRLPLKKPWEVTGVASSLEYRSHLPLAPAYRQHAPGSPPVVPKIPQAETDKIFDIKYYTRDTRRAKRNEVIVKVDPHKPEILSAADLVPGRPWRPSTGFVKRKDLLDYDNNGYT